MKFPFTMQAPSQRCPNCDQPIEAESINITEGVALCPGCGKLSRLSKLNYSTRSLQEILAQPPRGCSIGEAGRGVRLLASMRSLGGFIPTALFALFWNSIVSLFVLLAIAGLYSNLIGPLPHWFPAPGVNEGQPEMNGKPMDLGMTLFLCLFLTPFVAVGIGTLVAAITCLIGKVEVVIDEWESYVATGIGFIRWKKRFDSKQIQSVSFYNSGGQSDSDAKSSIELVADRTIKFGSGLREDRKQWLWAAVKEILLNPNSNLTQLSTSRFSRDSAGP
jgi:hypothetical protein